MECTRIKKGARFKGAMSPQARPPPQDLVREKAKAKRSKMLEYSSLLSMKRNSSVQFSAGDRVGARAE